MQRVEGLKELFKALQISLYRGADGMVQITNEDAQKLADVLKINACIEEISLSFTQRIDAVVIALADALKINAHLRCLRLSHYQLTNVGVSALADALKTNANLEKVYLSNSKITGAGVSALADVLKANAHLKEIDLSCNQITDAGVGALANALKTNVHLKEINLSCNRITNVGAISLADALKINTNLKVLSLYGCNITDVGATALAQAFKKLSVENIDLQYNQIIDSCRSVLADAQESINDSRINNTSKWLTYAFGSVLVNGKYKSNQLSRLPSEIHMKVKEMLGDANKKPLRLEL